MIRVSTIDTGFFKLDGGAMFGIVPRQLWERLNPPDEKNLCTWAMRCLLVETDDRRILIDTGLGDKQDAKFRSHFHPHGKASLLNSLAENDLKPEDITDVLLTHLHFDHVGGAVRYDDDGKLIPTFPNATYWSNEVHFKWALYPNAREKASFLRENFVPLQDAGQLRFVDTPGAGEDVEWLPGISLRFLYGHTEAMMMPIIRNAGQTLVYCADLIPSSYHIGLPYVMAYDLRPLVTLQEKERLLGEAVEGGFELIFEHDPVVISGTLRQDERGRIVLDN